MHYLDLSGDLGCGTWQSLRRSSAARRSRLGIFVFSREAFFGKNEVPWVTQGFYVTLAKLLDRPAPYGVVVSAVVLGSNGGKTYIVA